MLEPWLFHGNCSDTELLSWISSTSPFRLGDSLTSESMLTLDGSSTESLLSSLTTELNLDYPITIDTDLTQNVHPALEILLQNRKQFLIILKNTPSEDALQDNESFESFHTLIRNLIDILHLINQNTSPKILLSKYIEDGNSTTEKEEEYLSKEIKELGCIGCVIQGKFSEEWYGCTQWQHVMQIQGLEEFYDDVPRDIQKDSQGNNCEVIDEFNVLEPKKKVNTFVFGDDDDTNSTELKRLNTEEFEGI